MVKSNNLLYPVKIEPVAFFARTQTLEHLQVQDPSKVGNVTRALIFEDELGEDICAEPAQCSFITLWDIGNVVKWESQLQVIDILQHEHMSTSFFPCDYSRIPMCWTSRSIDDTFKFSNHAETLPSLALTNAQPSSLFLAKATDQLCSQALGL